MMDDLSNITQDVRSIMRRRLETLKYAGKYSQGIEKGLRITV